MVTALLVRRKYDGKHNAKDRQALAKFVETVTVTEHPVSVMFTPYGEAMIHKDYQQALATLSSLPQITSVGIQTNLSFKVAEFIERICKHGGQGNKIRLWCSYHPEMVSQRRFISQCQQLQEAGITFCVGAVAATDPAHIACLQSLRSSLPVDCYLWLNRMDGLKRPYTPAEIAIFTAIDPEFTHELTSYPASLSQCRAGLDSVLITADGSSYACHLSKGRMGNLYHNKPWQRICQSRHCRCYVAYVHRQPSANYFRIPKKKKLDALFLDLDGTVFDEHGKITESVQRALTHLAQTIPLYLATSRPYKDAMRKCASIRTLIRGGVFGNGGYLEDNGKNLSKTNAVPLDINAWLTTTGLPFRLQKKNSVVYKITVIGHPAILSMTMEHIDKHYPNLYHSVLENQVLSITAAGIDKGYGVAHIKAINNYYVTAAVGDSSNDLAMFAAVDEKIASLNRHTLSVSEFDHALTIEQLPLFFY